MNVIDEIVQKLEPIIQEIIDKKYVELDSSNTQQGELLVETFDSLIAEYSDAVINAISKQEENPVQDNSVVLSKIDDIKADTKQILGTVVEIKTDIQSFIDTNKKASENIYKEYGKNIEEQDKKLEKLQKTAKQAADNSNKSKSTLKKIGKFILGGMFLFVFGDLIKDLLVNAFDKLLSTKFAKNLKIWIDRNFPKFGKTLSTLSDWWTTKAKPWLDDPKHSFANLFSTITEGIANIWEKTVQLVEDVGSIMSKLGIRKEYTTSTPEEYIQQNQGKIDDITFNRIKSNKDLSDSAKAEMIMKENLALERYKTPEELREHEIRDRITGATLHIDPEDLTRLQVYRQGAGGQNQTAIDRLSEAYLSNTALGRARNRVGRWYHERDYEFEEAQQRDYEDFNSPSQLQPAPVAGTGEDLFRNRSSENISRTMHQAREQQWAQINQSTVVHAPTYFNVQESTVSQE